MLIALLALLGVNLIVIVVLLTGVLSRKRWITRQPAAFRGAVRIVDGEVPGLGVKWKRGYGRWVKEIRTSCCFHGRFGSAGHRPPRVSIAMAMKASGVWNPLARLVSAR